MEPRGPLARDDEEALRVLRAALERAGVTVQRVEQALGAHELSARPADLVVHARRLSGSDAFSTLARLFLLGLPVEQTLVAAALAPLPLATLADLGVARIDRRAVRATVRLVPHGDYYVASDIDHTLPPDAAAESVPGIQAPSVTLAKLAVRREVASALDVGTGCGIQALLAARHSGRVVATDVNPRALELAAFNARLNGASNVELRLGDTFSAVEGERFHLVVCNPPYVISPDSTYIYRDSGRPGDELCREIVERTPDFLEEGGFGHVLVSWAHAPDGDWSAPLREWVAGRGCDAWLLHYKSEDPLTHAANWLRPLMDGGVDEYEDAVERWVRYLRDLGIEAIGYGAVVLRRRSRATNWVRADEIPIDRLEPAGEHTLRVFAAQDYLAGLRDEGALLDERLRLVERHRIELALRSREGALAVESQTLVLEEGLGFRVGLDRYTGALLPHLDGTRPLREVLTRVADELELGERDRDAFVPAALPVVRRLLELGFLVRVE